MANEKKDNAKFRACTDLIKPTVHTIESKRLDFERIAAGGKGIAMIHTPKPWSEIMGGPGTIAPNRIRWEQTMRDFRNTSANFDYPGQEKYQDAVIISDPGSEHEPIWQRP